MKTKICLTQTDIEEMINNRYHFNKIIWTGLGECEIEVD